MKTLRIAVVMLLSLAVVLLGGAPTGASPGITELVSVASDGSQGNGGSGDNGTGTSADGRYVAFYSRASNLVAGDTNANSDVFVHDRQTGVTERVSVDSAGNQANGASGLAWRGLAISADGRYVAFQSWASNLAAGDTNANSDVFVHDRQTGATERVSVDSAGNQGNGHSYWPAISADGRYVAFSSEASNLVAGDTNGGNDVFVHDRQTGATERVSVDSAGNQGNNSSGYPSISGDGRYVAFTSWATNLVTGDTNGYADVFVRDRQTGATERVSVDSAGNEGNNNSGSQGIGISGDGHYVAFYSCASNLVAGDTNVAWDIFIHDRQTGATERVSVDSAGNGGNNNSWFPSITADGRYVAFQSWASNLVPGDTNGRSDIFVHDRQTGETERVSVASDGSQANMHSYGNSTSGDGRFVAFLSHASNLVAGDTNSRGDVFVHDRGCPDDGDGISYEIDTDPCAFSDQFSDVPLGGTTFGRISNRADLSVEVTDVLNPEGVRIKATGGTKRATVLVCEKPPTRLKLNAGDETVVTCGSATVQVLSGPIEAEFDSINAELPTGTTVTIDEVTPGTYHVSNSPASADSITVGGQVVAPGENILLTAPAPVGGIAELPDASGSSGRNYIALGALAAAALLALTAGAWYARRRLS